jgi:hypothetical protein
MSTIITTPEMQQANAEILLGENPSRDMRKISDKAQRFTASKRQEIVRFLKQTEAERPVTLLNLNPFPLKINGGMYFPDEVPAKKLGERYAVYVIRNTRWGHKDLGADAQNMMQVEPVPAIPRLLASEYMREYAQQEGSTGGVLCYEGDKDPKNIKRGEKVRVPEVAFSESGELYVEVKERDFHEVLEKVVVKRNQSIMKHLQYASAWYENDVQRMNVNDRHRDMARLALAEGLIEELPRWVLQANPEGQKKVEPCPSCMTTPKAGAIICINCNHIFDVLEAYRNTRIAFGAVEMDRLTADEWKIAHKIKEERDKARSKSA